MNIDLSGVALLVGLVGLGFTVSPWFFVVIILWALFG